MHRRLVVLMLCLLAPACAGEPPSAGPGGRATPSPSASFTTATALIETDGGPVLFTVEIAETEQERARGLMGRTRLEADAGMVFLFFEEHTGGFWMKDTLIPLSIAFFDARGRILEILDMEPCEKDPCPVYDPGVAYSGALEVNRGAFDRHGVETGDVIRVSN